jgi:hypothetical protein
LLEGGIDGSLAQVSELERDGPRQRLLREGAEAVLTEEELKALRQEIEEQETLLKAYQVRYYTTLLV